uniref:Uncharacterized protein n=1 Tax=Schlesneria paludicola TaxID=360056 RepID=A0A7C2K261_9PLAN
MPRSWSVGMGIFGLLLAASSVSAQELRVYTRTVDLSDSKPGDEGRAPVVARSLTLFHAGKVYDYIESLREVTIYDPAHRRFFVIQDSLGAYAEVTQDEVRRFLGLAEDKVRELTGDLVRQPDSGGSAALDLLQLQLRPQFEVRYDESARRLRLQAPRFQYDVVCASTPQLAAVDAYLKYADAIAELNAVLHPHSLLPGPRWQVNQELRQRQMLPVSVRRRMEYGRVSDLQSLHEWAWKLDEHDRKLITHWESQLSPQKLRPMSFKQLQQSVLGGGLAQR